MNVLLIGAFVQLILVSYMINLHLRGSLRCADNSEDALEALRCQSCFQRRMVVTFVSIYAIGVTSTLIATNLKK
jgi:hypothetical protein